jgi:RecJ-like exonuclease
MVGVSKNRDGWTSEPCPSCKGTGEVETEHSYGPCGACGGTGEEYDASQDDRECD